MARVRLLDPRELFHAKGPWHDGDTANLSIGQGYLTVTPLQMAVAMAAVANGGDAVVPEPTAKLLRLAVKGKVTVDDILNA